MKAGANPSDIRRIQRMFAEEKTAKEISKATHIDLKVVKAFAPAKPAKTEK